MHAATCCFKDESLGCSLQEPADASDPIYQHPNVIATPHTGVSTIDVYDELFSIVSQNIIRQHDGGELLHRLV